MSMGWSWMKKLMCVALAGVSLSLFAEYTPEPWNLAARQKFAEQRFGMFIHFGLYDYPMGYLPVEWLDRIEYAQFLHDGSEIFLKQPPKVHSQTGDTHQIGGLALPMKKPAVEVPVIEVWLKK